MAGYSQTALIAKLGIKPGMKVALMHMPESIATTISPLPQNVTLLRRPGAETDYIHYFADSEAQLRNAFPALKKSLSKTGALWISWRKGKNSTDLTETIVRAIALRGGLVDVKVCAVDQTWSGLKLVYRLKDR